MLENLNWQMTLMNSSSLIYPDMFLTLVGSVMSWWNIHCHLWAIHWGYKSTHAVYHTASFLNFFQVFTLWLSLRLCMFIMSPHVEYSEKTHNPSPTSYNPSPTTPHLYPFTYNLIYNPSPTPLHPNPSLHPSLQPFIYNSSPIPPHLQSHLQPLTYTWYGWICTCT